MGDAVRLRRTAVRNRSDYCPASIVFTVRLRRNTQLGRRSLLGTGVTVNSHPPLNLAHVRQRGSRLEANEVFVFPTST